MDRALFNKLLKFGVERGASDIHFQVGSPPCYRLKGDLLRAKADPLTPEMTLTIAEFLLQDRQVDIERFFPEQDTSYSLPGVSRFRVSIFRQRGTIGCVLRVIPFRLRSFEELNLPGVLRDICSAQRGMILIVGATGMGKSTTLATMIQQINQTRKAHIITIEDPIEFLFENDQSLIIQREVGTDTHSYKEAMLSALRQDPDVIMLGEIRDADTANVSLKAAETGHLFFSTLHTPDATATIKRFTGFFMQDQLDNQLGRLAECLQAVICLRLVPKADRSGVVPAVEILRVTHTIQECIRQIAKHGEIPEHIKAGQEMYSMQTLDQHLIELVGSNTVAAEVAKQHATHPADFERALMLDS